MKYELIPNLICRICLKRKKKLRSIYESIDDGDDEPPYKMLQTIIGTRLNLDDATEAAAPHSVCKDCALSLCLAYEFRSRALKSQHIIEQYCRQNLDVDVLQLVKEETADSYDDTQSVLDESSVDEEELKNNAIMPVEEFETDWIDVTNNFSDDAHLLLEDGDEAARSVGSNDNCTTGEPDMLYTISATSPASSDINEDLPQYNEVQLKDKDATKNGKKKRGRKQKSPPNLSASMELLEEDGSGGQRLVKSTADKNSHICDVCGNIFPLRGRLMEHRRRHDKNEIYSCEVCGMRFHLREKLRKHMYSHSGGKPFGCSFCSRTFFYESVKKAHEAIHTGHKPYVCGVCQKAFAYAHALKTHQLIHADVKLYHCAYCEKDFRLLHHMKQHMKTFLHQSAVREAQVTGNVDIPAYSAK